LKTDTVKINEAITARRVNLVGENGERLGEFKTSDAMSMAFERGLDLVEMDASSDVPFCKIMDYSKFLYQKKKKQKSSSSTTIKVKQLTFSPRTEEHDLMILVNKARGMLADGDKVRFVIQFRGREMAHTALGFERMQYVLAALSDEVTVESPLKLMGNVLSAQVTLAK